MSAETMLVLSDRGQRREIPLEDGRKMVAGRDEHCEIPIDSTLVSRRHCQFMRSGGRVFVRDLGSKNGSWLNGERLEGERPLAPGDVVRLAKGIKLRLGGEVPAAHHDDAPTPEDARFAPEAAGGEGAAELVPPQPAALARVEEAPPPVATAAPVPAPPPRTPPARRALLLLAIVVPVLVAVAMLVKLAGGGPSSAPPPAAPAGPRYEDLLDRAVAGMEAGDHAGAGDLLRQAAAIPGASTAAARVLQDYNNLWASANADLTRLNWRQAEVRIKEVLDARPNTAKVRAFAQERLAWMRREEANAALVCRLKGLVDAKDWVAASSEAGRIPADSVLRQQSGGLLARIEDAVRGDMRAAADQDFQARRWEEAGAGYGRLLARTGAGGDPAVPGLVAQCARRAQERDAVKRGQDLAAQGRAAEARRELGTVAEGSPYHEEARALLARMALDDQMRAVRALYEAGKGQEALDQLAGRELEGGAQLAARIRGVMALAAEASAAMAAQDLEKALARWKALMEAEPDAANRYHADARLRAQEWERPASRAAAYKALGDEAYQAKRYKAARAWYEKSSGLVPEAGKEELRQMDSLGVRVYNRAINPGSLAPAEVQAMLEDVTQLLGAAHPVRQEAQKALEKLRGR